VLVTYIIIIATLDDWEFTPCSSMYPCDVCRAKADASRLLSDDALADCTVRVTIGTAGVDPKVFGSDL
jgi:hypothetical protein